MAERRMLTRKVTDNDNFVELPATAQALYLHLTMSADDDGFCSQVAVAMFRAHAKKKDLELLVAKRYLLRFDNGVMVIKHWRMANAIRKDRYEPTVYQEEAERLTIKDNLSYTMATDWQPTGNQPQPQDRLGKDRVGKDNINTPGGARAPVLARAPAHAREEDEEAEEDKDLAKVMNFFMNRINPAPSPTCLDMLKHYTASLTGDVVVHAMEIAIDERKTGWSYIQAILARYEREGVKSMEEVKRLEEERERQKSEQQKPGPRAPKTPMGRGGPYWTKDEMDNMLAGLEKDLKKT